jgi:hypothetical protein
LRAFGSLEGFVHKGQLTMDTAMKPEKWVAFAAACAILRPPSHGSPSSSG